MMIRIVEEIRIDNEWRTRDIAKMKMTFSQIPEQNRPFFLRLCIPMIYAHWEGLVSNSLISLIKYLNSIRLTYQEAHLNLFVLSLGDKFKRLQSKQSFEQRCDFSNTFINLLENELKFEKKINTKSNLNYAVLKTLCEIFLLDISDFQPYERDIDKLVGIRNRIAHGENSYIFEDIHDINKYFLLLQNISDTFLNNIEKFIVEERYRKPVDEEQSDSLSNEEE